VTQSPEHGFADDARRYRLDSRIATGGMGEVWRATDTVLGRQVAVKLLKTEFADSPAFRSRFETEARHAASLHHPNVAAVYDFGEADTTDGSGVHRPYLVMEVVDGQPLSALLAEGRPLDPEATRHLLAQAADALGAAHTAGIVHRDVKPANLLVTPDRQVKITDFGIARAAEGMALTETGQVMGTPQYLSPEQAEGKPVTPASDVYSLGVVAFECLAGHRPFVAETAIATALAHLREPVPELPAEVPADLRAVVRRAMAKSPGDRFADGDAFAVALRDPATAATAVVPAGAAGAAATQVLAGAGPAAAAAALDPAPTPAATPVPTDGDGPAHAGGTSGRRRAPWLWLLLGLLLVAAIVAIVLLAGNGDDVQPSDRHTRQPTGHPARSGKPTGAPSSASGGVTRSPSATTSSRSSTPSASSSSSSSSSPSASASPSPTVTQAPTTSAPASPPASSASTVPTTPAAGASSTAASGGPGTSPSAAPADAPTASATGRAAPR
jgi:eukaryotic-like serine/threonine-protein kinase